MNSETEETILREPTVAEIRTWVFKHEAIAPCFVRDVFNLTEDARGGFFWLGRVPCRTVRLMGLVVGIQVYEKRIRYTVDDGTSVIDCLHRPPPPPRTPVKRGAKPKPVPDPKPIARVGDSVRVVGTITLKYDTREVSAMTIERCTSPNDEPRHWCTVHSLHQTSYSLPEPFVIPPTSTRLTALLDPSLLPETITPPTPSTTFSTPASAVASSPAKSITSISCSPLRFRHPDRLRSSQLTEITFRMYVKYYMDNASAAGGPSEGDNSDTDSISFSLSKIPSTPTRRRQPFHAELTPRPSSSETPDRTPRRRVPALLYENESPRGATQHITGGFTLSFLRRVPELSDLAHKVLKAQDKQSRREERRKAKETRSTQNRPTSTTARVEEPMASRVKRLFQSAVVQLLRGGNIALYDGPVRPCLGNRHPYNTSMWKVSTSPNTTMGADSTVSSSIGGTTLDVSTVDEENYAELSDPESHEEAYVPVLPHYLAACIEKVMDAINESPGLSLRKPLPPTKTRGQRVDGATKEEIFQALKHDDRWRYITESDVGKALEFLDQDSRAWRVDKERWKLTV